MAKSNHLFDVLRTTVYLMMEKRYLMNWYALAAVIGLVAFLLIQISQQNATVNTVRYTLAPSKWLQDRGSQALQHGRNQ